MSHLLYSASCTEGKPILDSRSLRLLPFVAPSNCFLGFIEALQHRGIRDPGLYRKGGLFPLVVLAPSYIGLCI
jgi:hypothetical protein